MDGPLIPPYPPFCQPPKYRYRYIDKGFQNIILGNNSKAVNKINIPAEFNRICMRERTSEIVGVLEARTIPLGRQGLNISYVSERGG